jgi:hypothetical protein
MKGVSRKNAEEVIIDFFYLYIYSILQWSLNLLLLQNVI